MVPSFPAVNDRKDNGNVQSHSPGPPKRSAVLGTGPATEEMPGLTKPGGGRAGHWLELSASALEPA